MTRIATFLGIVLTALVMSAELAFAQAPVITSPVNGQVFKAGPDYATDVLSDPWDFNNVEDVGQYPYEYNGWQQSPAAFRDGPSAFGVGSGRFTATAASSDPAIGLLYPGGIGIANPGRNGQRYPVATSRYRKLAFRMRSAGAGAHAAFHWYAGGIGDPRGASTAQIPAVTDGERIYQIDLVANHTSGPAWQGNMVGLRLDPIEGPNGAQADVDWVRLTAGDGAQGAAMMTVSANNCGGSTNVEVQDAAGGAWMSVGASRTFNYGILPPGSYNLRITCGGGTSAPVAFAIADPPRATVLQPDERGGVDYATAVRGNPWDMDDLGDVPASSNVEPVPGQPVFAQSPAGGLMLRARNVASPNSSVMGDPNLFLVHGESASRPIASRRYRYLTFTMQLHGAFDLAEVQGGSTARIGWASADSWNGYTASGTRDVLIWPGRNTYTIDLGALSVGNGLEPCTLHPPAPAPPNPCLTWTQASPRFLRFDPHEFGFRQVPFDLDNITLAAPDEVVQGGTFPIQWHIAGGGSGTVNLYYEAPGVARTPINSSPLPLSTTSYAWNVGGLAAGDYSIYVEVNDTTGGGSYTRGSYSTGVLRVIAAANNPVVTLASHGHGSTAYAPFTIAGCAYNSGGAPADEVHVYAHPLQGQLGGVVQLLGYNVPGGLGSIGPQSCGSGPGYAVSNVNLTAGLWTFRVLARNPVTGDFDEVQSQNVTVSGTSAPPTNLRVAAVSGNTVTLAWDAPPTAVTHYLVQGAATPDFAGLVQLPVPASPTSLTITLGNGTYYVRVRPMNQVAIEGPPSNVISFTLPGGGAAQPPGAITLGGRLNANPILLNWSQAGGGPATYTLVASAQRGGADIVVPLGAATSLPPIAVPPGATYYARVIATNGAGSTVSNEVTVHVPMPGPPGGPPIQLDPIVSGNTVTLRWTPPADGAVPTGYYVGVRVPGSEAILLAIPVGGTSITVPGAPSGTFTTSMAAIYGSVLSGESNRKTFTVP